MQAVTPPKYVRQVLSALSARGHIACIVGGSVRDMLMGETPHDWDICTSALPEQVMAIFPDNIPTGLKHGTVTVKSGSKLVEVTTFRTEGAYADHRHPDSVSFVGDLVTDLSRRDFTVNAMAVSSDGRITDPFGGVDDLRAGIIRCVGNPDARFNEDALRMFRAIRFSARLGFSIEDATFTAIGRNARLSADLAAERIAEELTKTLMTGDPAAAFRFFELGLMDSYIEKRPKDLSRRDTFSSLPRKSAPRWAALCRELLLEGCIASVQDFLKALRLDGRTVRCCRDTALILSSPMPKTPLEWKRLLREYGPDTAACAAGVYDALYFGTSSAGLRAVLKSGECFTLSHLAVNGLDIAKLGYRGKEIGTMLSFLLDYVIEYPENNRRELLLGIASRTEE